MKLKLEITLLALITRPINVRRSDEAKVSDGHAYAACAAVRRSPWKILELLVSDNIYGENFIFIHYSYKYFE